MPSLHLRILGIQSIPKSLSVEINDPEKLSGFFSNKDLYFKVIVETFVSCSEETKDAASLEEEILGEQEILEMSSKGWKLIKECISKKRDQVKAK